LKKLPKAWQQRITFNQALPEEMARHLARCAAKVPTKSTQEFLQYRWAILMADLTVQPKGGGEPRKLSAGERKHLHDAMKQYGTLSKEGLEKFLREAVPRHDPSNLDDLFEETPERAKELYVDPARHYAANNELAKEVMAVLPERLHRRILNELRRGKAMAVTRILQLLQGFGYAQEGERFSAKLQWLQDAQNLKVGQSKGGRRSAAKPKKQKPIVPIMDRILKLPRLSGRARYHRNILTQATNEVMAGLDPRKKAFNPADPNEKDERKPKDGCLVETPPMRLLALGLRIPGESVEAAYRDWLTRWRAKRSRKGKLANEAAYQRHGDPYARLVYEGRSTDQWLAAQTNNHLVRQRLLVLRRLTDALIAQPKFANGKPERIGAVSLEVTRNLLEFSGMQKKDTALSGEGKAGE